MSARLHGRLTGKGSDAEGFPEFGEYLSLFPMVFLNHCRISATLPTAYWEKKKSQLLKKTVDPVTGVSQGLPILEL